MKKKDKLAVYLTPEKKAELERRCHEDGSRSMTAFIGRALDFYLGYLDAQDAGIFLPPAIRSCIDGRLGTMENRVLSIEITQIEIQRVLDESGHAPAAVLVTAPLQLGFLLRREIDRQLVFFAHFLLLSGG